MRETYELCRRNRKKRRAVVRNVLLMAFVLLIVIVSGRNNFYDMITRNGSNAAGHIILGNPDAAPAQESADGGTDTGPEKDGESTVSEGNEGWQLILVNRSNLIPEDYTVELTELVNGHAVDSRIYPSLQQMFDDARADGIMPTISSSYRTQKEQQAEMDEKIDEYEMQGYSADEARKKAEEWLALPGTSEHQLGLAVDITTADSSAQDASIVWQWLRENCAKYGFILRYPEDKTDITGVIYEPWHFRYVGEEAAKEIMEQGVCLEEYLGRQ